MYLSHIFILMLLLPLTTGILLWLILPKGKWKWICILANAIMFAFFLVTAAFDTKDSDAQICRMWTVSTIVTFCTVELIILCFELISRCFRQHQRWQRFTRAFGVGLSILFLICMLYAFTLGQRQYRTTQIEFADHRIPKSFDGYRIAFISDWHVDAQHGTPSTIDSMVNYINQNKADLIVFGGDIVTHHSGELDEFTGKLSQLSAHDGVLSVLGNHDYMGYMNWDNDEDRLNDTQRLINTERRMGWNVLLNEHCVIRRNNDSICIVGVENDSQRSDLRHPQLADLTKATEGIGSNVFKILITHDPSHWRRNVLGKTSIPLTLSGHTHGLQLTLPGVKLGDLIFSESEGMYQEKEQTLYVTSGIGSSLMRARFGAWPEVVVVTLRSK